MDYLSQRTIRPNVSPLSSNLLNEIEAETEWSGAFLQKIRFAQNVSLEEMVESTKISKNYLIAIEEENFGKLPAPVFVRGFIIQVARVLKLPQQKVAQGFLNRYNHARSKA